MYRTVIAAAVLAAASPARAGHPVDKGVFGIGLAIGEPSGINAKLYLKDDQALQATLGFGFFGFSSYQLDVDYLFHPWIIQDKESFVLPVYLGPGVRFVDYQTAGSSFFAPGLLAVIGLLFDFKTVPLDAFVEGGPILEYRFGSQHTAALSFTGAIGVRYYF
jgi:hypothetical protein